MFGKLVKHEFKATYKLFVLIIIIMLAVTAVGSVILSSDFLNKRDQTGLLTLGSASAYYMVLFLAVVLGTLYIVIRFYRNVYGREGYLTNTLPVSTHEIICSKLLVGTVWEFVITILCAVSVVSLFYFGRASYYGTQLGKLITELIDSCSVKDILLVLSIVVLLLVSFAQKNLSYYFCCSIGQLSNQHKVAFSIIAFVALNFVIGVLSNIVSIFFAVGVTAIGNESIVRLMEEMANKLGPKGMLFVGFNVASVICVIFGAVFYIINYKIMKNRLNLE